VILITIQQLLLDCYNVHTDCKNEPRRSGPTVPNKDSPMIAGRKFAPTAEAARFRHRRGDRCGDDRVDRRKRQRHYSEEWMAPMGGIGAIRPGLRSRTGVGGVPSGGGSTAPSVSISSCRRRAPDEVPSRIVTMPSCDLERTSPQHPQLRTRCRNTLPSMSAMPLGDHSALPAKPDNSWAPAI
jgi:hypothetical protein